MKKTFAIVALAFVAGLFFARASTTLLGSLVSVNGTQNTTAAQFGVHTFAQPTFLIQNGGVASTNELTANLQISFDNTNFLTVATYNPSVTNATTDTWRPALTNQPVYVRLSIVTTNAVNVGAILQ